MTQQEIVTEVLTYLTKSEQTDETRFDEDFIAYKINQIKAEKQIQQFKITNVIDRTWVQHLGKLTCHKVNISDDVTLAYENCTISKTTLPPIVSLEMGNGNQDLGLTLMGSDGRTQYFPYSKDFWRDIPEDSERNLFNYFDRVNTDLYLSHNTDYVYARAILVNPEDAKIISSTPIATGSIVLNTVYRVKFGQVVYNGVTYQENDTFTGTAVTTFAGTGKVYANSQIRAYRETDQYPCTPEMVRQIVLELLTKEYRIEMSMPVDNKNDSKDDPQKS